jgi:hypothetical protein
VNTPPLADLEAAFDEAQATRLTVVDIKSGRERSARPGRSRLTAPDAATYPANDSAATAGGPRRDRGRLARR